jgi:colanic acid biosynthesis glycosyl transferase WcaI
VFTDLCAGLAARGFDVTVRAPYPYFPEWRDKTGRNGWRIWRYEDSGMHIERYGIFIPRNPRSVLQRALYESSFLVSLLRGLPRSRDFDVVLAFCPITTSVVFGAIVKRLFGAPLWLNVQDIATDAANNTGMIGRSRLNTILAAIQNWAFNQADVWSSIAPGMIERLEKLRKNGQPILLMPNWADSDLLAAIAKARSAKQRRRDASKPIKLLYAGNIGGKQDLAKLCCFFRQTNIDFSFRIFGNGSNAAELNELVTSWHDPRFFLGPFLDATRLADELTEADFYVITEKSGIGSSFFPSKFVSGISAGTPILAVCDADSPLGIEMAATDVGPMFQWQDLSSLALALASINEKNDQIARWQQNAITTANVLSPDTIISRFATNLRQLGERSEIMTDRSSGDPSNRFAH